MMLRALLGYVGLLSLLISPGLGWGGEAAVDREDIILFLNTNDAPQEIDAAQRAASIRGATLVIVPPDSARLKGLQRALDEASDRYWNLLKKGVGKLTPSENALLARLENEKKSLSREIEKNKVSEASIESTLRSLKAKGLAPRTVVVSGHSGGAGFCGTTGEVSLTDFAKAVLAVDSDPGKRVASSLRAIHLFGCHTGSPKNLKDWKRAFPRTRLISGWDSRAPLKTDPLLPAYLTDLLVEEKTMIDKADLAGSANLLRKVDNATRMGAHKPVVCLGAEHPRVLSTTGAKPLGAFECPDRELRKAQTLARETFNKFNDAALSGAEDVPLNTDSGPLRDLYALLRHYEYCEEELRDLHVPSADHVFRLLFFRNVRMNFQRYYQHQIDELDTIFAKYRMSLRLHSLGRLNRKQILRLSKDLRSAAESLKSKAPAAASKADFLSWHFDLALVELSSLAVPFNWHDQVASVSQLERPEIDGLLDARR